MVTNCLHLEDITHIPGTAKNSEGGRQTTASDHYFRPQKGPTTLLVGEPNVTSPARVKMTDVSNATGVKGRHINTFLASWAPVTSEL